MTTPLNPLDIEAIANPGAIILLDMGDLAVCAAMQNTLMWYVNHVKDGEYTGTGEWRSVDWVKHRAVLMLHRGMYPKP